MKKIWIFLLITLSSFMFMNVVKANNIDSINMDINIDENGTAHVVETWRATLDQGTEGYKSYGTLGNANITNFKVSDEANDYTTIDSWNTSASFDDKAYKAGINYNGDVLELCFGISKYGSHIYTLSYDIEGFVAETDDSQIIYWTLLPNDLASYTDNVVIKIYADDKINGETPVWGYGNKGGLAYAYDNYIEMSNDALSDDEYMTILVKFDKGTFNTSNNIGHDFDYYYNMALKGAEKYKKSIGEILSIIFGFIFTYGIIIVAILGSIFGAVVNGGPKSGSMKLDFSDAGKTLPKDVNMFRDIPCNKDLYRAYWVAYNYELMNKQTDFLGAILLKWLKQKQIKVESKTVGKVFKKEDTTIVFDTPDKQLDTELETKLYSYMYEASKDGILESKEFERWCSSHYSTILKWFDKILDYENEKLITEGKLVETTKKVMGFNKKVYLVDASMKEEAIQMKGLKEFFNEFENMKDKEAIDVMLWDEYLMYAQIFGVAKKVAEQFKKLYPDLIEQYDYDYNSIIFINSISTSSMTSASSARSRAESYSSGGGGFSSGGGGGGSFGSGGGGGFR